MANAQPHDNSQAGPLIGLVEGNATWTNGPVTYHIITAQSPQLLQDEFIAQLPPGSAQPAFLNDTWRVDMLASFGATEAVANIDLALDDQSLNPTYVVGADPNPDNLGSANLPEDPDGAGCRTGMFFNPTADASLAGSELGGINDRYHTVLHELMHTLGLGHPHDMSGQSLVAPGATADGFGMPFPYTIAQTPMSYSLPPYIPEDGSPDSFDHGRAVTPMAYDIAALHRMYGANMSTHTGNTIYRLTDPESEALDIDGSDGTVTIGRAYYSIWDAGGAADSIVYSGSNSVLINLIDAPLTTTRSAPLMMNSPPPSMIGRSPR